MSLRTLNWGTYPAQQADMHVTRLEGTSQIVDGTTSNQAGASGLYQEEMPTLQPNASSHLWRITMANLRSVLGKSPVIISATLNLYGVEGGNGNSFNYGVYRLLTVPDWADCDSRYLDKSAVTPWGGDASIYSPVPDVDYLFSYPICIYNVPGTANYTAVNAWMPPIDLTAELKYVLSANKDLMFIMKGYPAKPPPSGAPHFTFYLRESMHVGYRPYLSMKYVMLFEFFKAKSDNTIDLTQMLNNAIDIATGNLDLGGVERGQIGSPVPTFLKNLSALAVPHAEVCDDSPEWEPPAVDALNAGTKALAYVTMQEVSLSQKWFIHFTSATAFEVKTEGYQDNPTAIHPTYGGSGWDGVVGSDWTAPSGGMTIPAAAWSGTAVAGDLIYVYVLGQTTNASWPADSNTQVEMMKDSAGAPDAATIRPIKGQRTRVAAGVTIDSTVKTITVLHIDPSKWATNTKVFIGNSATIDEGYVSAAGAFSVEITFPSATGHVYAVGDKVCTTLPFRSLAAAVSAATTGAAGASQTNPAQIPLVGAVTKGFATSAVIAIMSASDPSILEEATIYAVDNAKITCAAFLTHDYPAGAWVIQAGGEQRFWERIHATSGTTEELKQGRLNVRT